MRNAKHLKAMSICGAAIVGLALALAACKNPLTQEVMTLAAVAASPKLSLTVNNGTATAIGSGASYDFGTVGTSDSPAVASFIVTNIGAVALAIPSASATFGGSNPGCFSYVSKPPASLAPKASASFTISFAPGTAGPKAATAIFATNDVSAQSFSFNLTGNGIDSAPMPVFADGDFQCYPSGSATAVHITCSNSSAKIYYTINGSNPSLDTLGTTTYLYNSYAAFTFDPIGYIKAIAKVDGLKDSAVATATFSKTDIQQPVLNVASRTFYPEDTVPDFTFLTATGNALILYSVDGVDPVYGNFNTTALTNGSGFTYVGTHTGGSFTLKAVAYVAGTPASAVTSATYIFKLSVPVFSATSSTSYHPVPFGVGLSAAFGSIFYISGAGTADPGSPNIAYTGVISLPAADGSSSITSIKAVAKQANWGDSAMSLDTFYVGGLGKWGASSWDQATWQ